MISFQDICNKQSIFDFIGTVKKYCEERHGKKQNHTDAHTKKGNLKKLLDEVVPLKLFLEEHYKADLNNYSIKYNEGNDGFDAQIFKPSEKLFENIEIAFPQLGKTENRMNRKLVTQIDESNCGVVNCTYEAFLEKNEQDDIRSVFNDVVTAKSQKDYSDCLLVFCFRYCDCSCSTGITPQEIAQINLVECLKKQVKSTKFKAKAVFLLEIKRFDVPILHKIHL